MITTNFAPMSGSGSFSIPCPAGERVRIVALGLVVSGCSTDEQILASFRRSTVVMLQVPTPQLDANTSAIAAAIGLSPVAAAGAPASNTASMALPDVWWPFDVEVQMAPTDNGSVTAGTLVYERCTSD